MKRVVISLLMIISTVFITSNVYAKELDKIIDYIITVEPNFNDGTLDITYDITWKVLDSKSEGPLTWVKIGTPNSNFTKPKALTKNIKRIKKYDNSYVRIDFKDEYKENEELNFKYSICQNNMYKISNDKCTYEFTPAWFNDIEVGKIIIKWKAKDVSANNINNLEDDYLILTKSNLAKGEKVTVEIEYNKNSFKKLNNYKEDINVSNVSKKYDKNSIYGFINGIAVGGVIIIIILVIIVCVSGGRDDGYFGNSGFYRRRDDYDFDNRSCVCVSSCACACACAGSGRAGCSKKDFYGTKINIEKINKIKVN